MRRVARAPAGPTRWRAGFTLIELMIAIVVVAILVAIAIPSYRGYVLRAGRTEATAALLRAQGAQEKFFVQNGRYAPALAPAPPDGLGIPVTTDSGRYGLTLAITEGGAGFRVTATVRPGSPQSGDGRCASFSLDHNGLRGARNSAGEDNSRECWR